MQEKGPHWSIHQHHHPQRAASHPESQRSRPGSGAPQGPSHVARSSPPGSTPLQPTPQMLLGARDHSPLIQLNPCASQAPCSLRISLALGLLGNGPLQLQPQESPSPRETCHVTLCLSTCCPLPWTGKRPGTSLSPRPQGCATEPHYALTGCVNVNKRWARRLQKAFS